MVENEIQRRATYRDTKRKQKIFRQKIDKLIKENRCATDKEREVLFDLYSDSNIGLGTDSTRFFLKNGKLLEIPNLEEFTRCLFYYDKNVVDGNFFFSVLGRHKDFTINISELWVHIRNRSFGVNALALAMSMRISKEQTHLGTSKAKEV